VPLAELVSRQRQMQRLLDKMAGMVGQYFLPKMEGVRISMVAPAGTAYLVEGARQEAVSWQQGQLLLSNAQLKGLPRASCNCKGRSCV
jgi:hypothetical protein